jgi:hypothetical protein
MHGIAAKMVRVRARARLLACLLACLLLHFFCQKHRSSASLLACRSAPFIHGPTQRVVNGAV